MKKQWHLCFEGPDGAYKTTTAGIVASMFRKDGNTVLETKEPGTVHLPLTMKLRELMLSNEFDSQHTLESREMLSQAIRSVHINWLKSRPEDIIIQDRGILSGKIYANSCGVDPESVDSLCHVIGTQGDPLSHYDVTVIMYHGSGPSVEVAKSAKQEWAAGDAIESKSNEFAQQIWDQYKTIVDSNHQRVIAIDVSQYGRDELPVVVFNRIKGCINATNILHDKWQNR
jgi:thymidylate kinase